MQVPYKEVPYIKKCSLSVSSKPFIISLGLVSALWKIVEFYITKVQFCLSHVNALIFTF